MEKGKNLPIEERLAPLELKPELASFDAGSINLGDMEEKLLLRMIRTRF